MGYGDPDQGREKREGDTGAYIGPHEVELQGEARLWMPFCLVFTLDLQDRGWGQEDRSSF